MSIINKGTGGKPSEPFRMCAATYLDMGLSVFPCMGEDGKKPCVKWGSLQKRRIGNKGLDKWLAKFPNANIGIATGKLSGITIVDCDNPYITLTELFNKFGETPLVVQSPSGGYHLYYKFNGEHNSQDAVQKIDIRGEGGLIIAPPSFNRVTGVIYDFVIGDISDFYNLPVIKNNSGIQNKYNEIQRENNEGERNQKLFKYLLEEAHHCYSLPIITKLAEEFNRAYLLPSLDDKEIQRTVASIWKYKARGTLSSAGEQFITLSMQKLKPIMFKHSRAFNLYADLISCHSGINEIFAISPKAYAKRCKWSDKTIRQEIQTLLRYGLIKQVYVGGKHAHDPSLYKFL